MEGGDLGGEVEEYFFEFVGRGYVFGFGFVMGCGILVVDFGEKMKS